MSRSFKQSLHKTALWSLTLVILLVFSFTLSGCGGGGGGARMPGNGPMVIPVKPGIPKQPQTSKQPPMETVTLPMDSVTRANPGALDPLPAFRAAPAPTSSRFDYQREAPSGAPALEVTRYTAPGTVAPVDLTPMLQRAAKLWTRRIAGLRAPGGDHQSFPHVEIRAGGRIIRDFLVQSFPHTEPGAGDRVDLDFLVGYEQPRCQGASACANHYGDRLMAPSGRANAGNNPYVSVMPAFLTRYVRDGQLTIGGFRVLAHEFGHVLDHGDERNAGMPHSDCRGGAIMCEGWDANVPAVPVEQDFDGIRHHYDLRPHLDYEQFGIWAEVPGGNSDLERFGVQVRRMLTVKDTTDIWDVSASEFISDQISIETIVRGTASGGPQPGAGTVTWSGDLIAVDTTRFQPVLGAARLSMDLAAVESLDASFTGLHRTDDAGMTHDIPNLDYTLMQNGTTWVDPSGAVAANFYAVGSDPGGAVAGRLHDDAQNLMGAFGALRDQ